MEVSVLNVEKREQVGKSTTTKLRKTGCIPGVCYGQGKSPINLSLNTKELMTILKSPLGLNSLIKLNGAEDRTVFVQEIQRDPVNRTIIHVDFMHVDTTKSVQRDVPIEFTGKPEGAKTGGILQIVARDIFIEALPGQIPHHVVIDVSSLQLGQSIKIDKVQLPEGCKAIYEQNYSICQVVSPADEKTAEGEPGETAVTTEGSGKPGESAKKAEDKAGGDKK